jgi:glucose uptake protein
VKMFALDTYSSSVVFCVITMLCWGSWANTQKLAAKDWRFELFYWDYVWGVLLLSLCFAFTLGSSGGVGRGFLADVSQALPASIGSAVLGGVIFNLANILLVAAIALAGMSVAFPVGIGIALVLGVVVNYIAAPSGNPLILFAGVAFVVVAILLDARAYQKLAQMAGAGSPPTQGIVISVISGILMGLFYRFVASGMTLDFSNPEVGKLGPYAAVVFFSIGVVVSSFLFVPILMKNPVAGTPVKMADYFRGSFRSHLTGVLGGAIWCIGMSFSLIASGRAGFAISYGLGQGATMVAACWGIFFWKEFKSAPRGTNTLLTFMMASYFLGLVFIILARVYG